VAKVVFSELLLAGCAIWDLLRVIFMETMILVEVIMMEVLVVISIL
jgi:hypothetical protein